MKILNTLYVDECWWIYKLLSFAINDPTFCFCVCSLTIYFPCYIVFYISQLITKNTIIGTFIHAMCVNVYINWQSVCTLRYFASFFVYSLLMKSVRYGNSAKSSVHSVIEIKWLLQLSLIQLFMWYMYIELFAMNNRNYMQNMIPRRF